MVNLSRFAQASVSGVIAGCAAFTGYFQSNGVDPGEWAAVIGAVLVGFSAVFWTRTKDDGTQDS